MKTRITTLALVALLVAGTTSAQGVRINECFTGVPDWAEVINFSAAPVDISGWTLVMNDDAPGGSTFTFPPGTTIAAGEVILVSESATAPAVAPGVQRFTAAANIIWDVNTPGACGLNDAGGAGVDLMIFGSATNLPGQTPPSPFTGSLGLADDFARNGNTDTDDASDWTTSGGAGTPGLPNPGQNALPPVASFLRCPSAAVLGESVSFTDTSFGAPTSWSWDLDGNGTIDSTAQNPSFTYTAAGTYDVTLTVTNSAGSDSLTQPMFVSIVSAGVTAPYVEDFNGAALGAEWGLCSETGGRIRLFTDGDPSPVSGGNALVMDVATSGAAATNTATLVVDLASTGGGILRYWFKETGDEDDADDAVFFSDGTNTILLQDNQGAPSAWTEYVFDLGAVAQCNGLQLTATNRIIFSQRDNFPLGTDGHLFDDVRIDPPVASGTGQANQLLASLDINGAAASTGIPGCAVGAGPYFADGATIDMVVTGQPFQPWLLLLGPLNEANLVIPGVGQLDIGLLGPASIADIDVVLNGTGTGFFDQLAVLDASGRSELSFGTGTLPPGVIGTFQAAVFNGGVPNLALSAAIEFTVVP